MSITLPLLLWEFLQTKFVLLMVFNLSVNLYSLVSLIISHWVWIGMNHTLPHSFTMMSPLLWSIYISSKERVGTNQHQLPHQDNSNYFTFTFRDSDSEYQDHMDILKCIPSIKFSGLSLIDPPKEQVIPVSGSLSPERAIG